MDPLDGLADEWRDRQRRDLAEALALGEWHRVGQDELADVRGGDAIDRGFAQHAVRGAGVDLGHALALERAGDLDERAAGVDLVIDDDRPLAFDRRR